MSYPSEPTQQLDAFLTQTGSLIGDLARLAIEIEADVLHCLSPVVGHAEKASHLQKMDLLHQSLAELSILFAQLPGSNQQADGLDRLIDALRLETLRDYYRDHGARAATLTDEKCVPSITLFDEDPRL